MKRLIVGLIGLILCFSGSAWGSDICKKGIHKASEEGHIDTVKKLVAQDKNSINAKDERSSFTPLHCAARGGQLEVAKFLISMGADVNSKTVRNETPLHEASVGGHVKVVEFLLQKGANVDDVGGYYKATPLWLAAGENHPDVMKVLISHGANVNFNSSRYGWTPLHTAAYGNHVEAARVLISNGANVNPRDEDGKTPLKVAKDRGPYNKEVVDFLRQHGGVE